MNDLSFRPSVESDLPAIVEMLADDELGREREDPTIPLNPKYLESFAAIDCDPNQALVMVEDNGAPVGCLQLTFVPGLSRLGMWRGQIESVRIAAGNRGRGLGRRMIEWAAAECRERGCGLVQLTTDKNRTEACKFHKALGFQASHEGMKLKL